MINIFRNFRAPTQQDDDIDEHAAPYVTQPNRQTFDDLLVASLPTIKDHEGLSLSAYRDTEGYLTIGYGHCIEKAPISKKAAEQILLDDAAIALNHLISYPWFSELTLNRKTALISMVFNLGALGFSKFKNTIQYLNEHDYENAAKEMMDSKWARQVPNRAKHISNIIKNG